MGQPTQKSSKEIHREVKNKNNFTPMRDEYDNNTVGQDLGEKKGVCGFERRKKKKKEKQKKVQKSRYH